MQLFEVFAAPLCGAATYEFAELKDGGIADGVDNGSSFAASADEAGFMENLQMLRYVGLIAVERVDEIADGFFSGFEGLKEAQAVGFTQSAKASSDEVDHFVGECGGSHVTTISLCVHIVI